MEGENSNKSNPATIQDDHEFRYFTDAVIRVQDGNFYIHKIVFCNLSMYFRALFLRHSSPDRRVFDMPDMSADIMQLITNFAYTGSVCVTWDNVEQLFLAADRLNIMSIVQACISFLERNLTSENCIGIWKFTDICFGPELKDKAFHHMLQHFSEVSSCEEFLQLSVEELADFLDRDDLNVSEESMVYEAILRWIANAPEERNKHFAVLLSKVRLSLTSTRYIRTLMSTSAVRTNPECVQIVRHARTLQQRMAALRPPLSFCSDRAACPRLPSAILFAIGGWIANGRTNTIEVYDIRANSWSDVTERLEHPSAYHGTVLYNGFIYCIGGFNGQDSTNTVSKYDVKNHTWHEATPTHRRRCYVSVAVLDGYIYAIGGRDGANRHRSGERYNPETNQWSFIASMHERRSDAGCAALNSRIYICGGFNGNRCSQTCEYFNPVINLWTRFTSMNVHRSGLGVIIHTDRIFAVGGYDGIWSLASVEAYNPETNDWIFMPPMLTPRSNFGIAVIESKLFVAGGYDGSDVTNCVEYFDQNNNQWCEATPMENSRSAFSCCVLSDVPNLAEYAMRRGTLPQVNV